MLRPYQVTGLARLAARHNKRLYAAWAPGAGKTRFAIEAMSQVRALSVLVACPAIARPVWKAELSKWAPDTFLPESAAIIYGRARKLSGPKGRIRDSAYNHPTQVVSYALMGEVRPTGWDMLVFDEAHRLGDPNSQQSRAARALVKANPNAAVLFLSGTPIPTEPKQVWQVADLCEPGWCGAMGASGEVPFKFVTQFCKRITSEYGTAFKGSAGPAEMARLRDKLSPFMHVVTDAEVAQFAPPIQLQAVRADERVSYPRYCSEWLADARTASTHQVIICYRRETAAEIAVKIGCLAVTGQISPEQRSAIIANHKAAGGVLVATSESIKESISLSHAKRALILQARTSPGQALQLLKRFGRQDSESPAVTNIDYLIELGWGDRAELLIERINAVQLAIGESHGASALSAAIAPAPMTPDRIASLLGSMLDGMIDDESLDAGDDSEE